jgi:hypothetical protein
MLPGFGPKKPKLKRSDIRVRTRGNLTALVLKDRRDVYMLTNMDPPPPEGNFCENKCPVKPHIMAQYNRHMGYVDHSDRMANTYHVPAYFQMDHEIIFSLSGSDSTQQLECCYLHAEQNIRTEISDSSW